MTGYAELGQLLQESLNMNENRKKPVRKNKKLNESSDYSHVQPGASAIMELAETVGEHNLLVEIIHWLPDDTLAEMAEDFRNTWDLDYEEE